jgi:SNF2 family DNA or RNA helicase
VTLELYPYQQDDLNFFSQWGRSANFSQPGVGKTPVAVRLIQELQGLPCLIVVPNAVRYHWQHVIEIFWRGEITNIYQYEGDKIRRKNLPNDGIIIVNYELFRQDFQSYFKKQQYQMAVFDEAHRLKNPMAHVTQCAYDLNAKYIHLMTGTPIINGFDDVYSYFHLLFPEQFKHPLRRNKENRLTYSSAYWRFVHRYGIVQNNGFGLEIVGLKPGTAHKLTKMIQQFSIRHQKKEVLPYLPEKSYQTIEVDLHPAQRKMYRELTTYMMAELDNEIVEVPNIIALMTKLRQITLSTALIGDVPNQNEGASAKKEALMELLQDRVLAKKKTVIMTEFKKWIDLLEKDLKRSNIKSVRITGSENGRQKQEAIDAFQEGAAEVCLCTIKAGGVGIDLTAADMVIFTDISWTATDNEQAEDRIHRPTQTKGAQIVKLFAKDTIDGVMLDRTLLKALTAQKVLGEETKEKLKKALFSQDRLLSV